MIAGSLARGSCGPRLFWGSDAGLRSSIWFAVPWVRMSNE